jgi:hypothetical protein
MHGIDAPTEGTGKTLLVETALFITSGTQPLLLSAPSSRDDAEWDKRITAALLAGRQFMVWDNVNETLDSASLAKLLTADVYGGRLLGASKDVELPVRLISVYTGNNVSLSREMARRIVRCRLNAHMEIPSQGREFKHTPLLEWVRDNRGDLLWAIYVLVRNWISRGRTPFKGAPLGSYEEWSKTVGGILDAAGVDGFLANREEVYAQVEESEGEHAFFTEWWKEFGDREVTVEDATLRKLAKQHLGLVHGSGTVDLPSGRQVGMRLSAMKGRVYGDFSVELADRRPKKYAIRRQSRS